MKALTQATAKLLAPVNLGSRDRLHIALSNDGTKFVVRIFSKLDDGRSAYASTRAQLDWVQRVPERKQLQPDGIGNWWEMAATDTTLNIIDAIWSADRITYDDDAKLVCDYLRITAIQQERVSENYARYKEFKEVPKNDLEVHPELPLSPYQQVALVNASMSEGYGLFMEQGTGKTPVAVARICNEARKLRDGSFDYTECVKSEAMLRNECDINIRLECDRLLTHAMQRIETKAARLDMAAKRRADRMMVNLNYSGSAQGVLQAAQRAVADANSWLQNQLAENQSIMRELKQSYLAAVEAEKLRIKARLEAIRDRKIAALKPKKVAGEDRPYRAIIACPNNVRANWLNEFFKFATEPGNVTVIRGGQIRRLKLLIEAFTVTPEDKYTVLIIGYDTLPRMMEQLAHIEWDLIVADESHFFKSPSTQRFETMIRLRDCAKARMPLTGTPITNTPLDLYAQFEFMGKGFSGFMSWKEFRTFYGVYEDRGGQNTLVGIQNLPFMQERLARYSFIVRQKEALPDLPDKVYDVIEVEMTSEQEEAYKQLATQLALEIENELDASENKAMTINNVLTKLLRLAHITSGFITWDAVYSDEGEELRPQRIEFFKTNPKLDALVEVLKQKGPNEKTIVWACWIPDIKVIAARLAKEGIKTVTFYGGTSENDRQEAERAFNHDADCKVFLGNPAAGGVGLNLLGYPPGRGDEFETNCDHELFYSQNWSPTARSQAEARAHRRGTRMPVRITDLQCAETIDEQIRDRVTKKILTALAVSDIRQILSNVLNGVQCE